MPTHLKIPLPFSHNESLDQTILNFGDILDFMTETQANFLVEES
jgi:hypothetical protein